MEVPTRRGGRISTLSPDELYANYISIVAGIPSSITT